MNKHEPGGMETGDFDVFTCPLDGIRLIEASAGTGKTWNICGLYLRLLLERDMTAASLLVVTFTRAATAELSSRIRERIAETLRVAESATADGPTDGADPFPARLIAAAVAAGLAPAVIAQRLRRALQTFDEAAIFTIHGFCQRALAAAPFAAGLPYTMELCEDDSAQRLEAARDFWRREIMGGGVTPALALWLDARGDSPERWAGWLREDMARPLAERRWDEDIGDGDGDGDGGADGNAAPGFDAVCRRLDAAWAAAALCWRNDGAGGGALAALMAATDAGALKKTSYRPDAIADAHAQWQAWLASGAAQAALPGKESRLDLFASGKLVPGTRKGAVTPAHPFFTAADELLAARAAFDGWLESARLRLLRRFLDVTAAGLRRGKRERRQSAFDDILWNAHEALAGGRQPWLAAALHARFPVALIDEFQDTDPLQFSIFSHLYASGGRHGGLFLVGDPKQAIYSFRGADLFAYLGARAHADSRHTLRRNQRSAPALIEACNRLFSANPAVFMLPGLAYERIAPGERARAPLDDRSASAGSAALRLWRIPRDENSGDDADGNDAGGNGADGSAVDENSAGGRRLPREAALARAAAASAGEIARLLAGGIAGEIRIGERPLAPADIAVLVRSHREGARMRRALAAVGVGSVELSQASVFHSDDAEELECVLRAVNEPAHRGYALAALATVAMGRDAAALARLAGDDAALSAALERFAGWRAVWRARGLGVMLRQWMADENVAARLLARADGERRLTNLTHLAELLQQAGEAAPEALLRFLAARRAEGGGSGGEGGESSLEAAQLRLESDRNLVRIVTIHRAKGLEYGIVFCPFLFDGHARPGGGGPMRAWHADGGALVLDYRREPGEEVAARVRAERQAEDLRLIYVALTRAVYRCYLVVGGYAKGTRNGGASHAESGRSLLNWMAAGGGMERAQWGAHTMTPAEIDARWRSLAAAAAAADAPGGVPAMAFEDLPGGAAVILPRTDTGPARPEAAQPPAIPPGWRIGSFSALVSAAAREDGARDHDAHASAAGMAVAAGYAGAEVEEESPPPAPDDILRFPRGPAAGDCVHALFERADLGDETTWAAAIAAALAGHPQRLAGVSAEESARRLPRMLRRLLADVSAAPLGGGLRLADIPRARQLIELDFHLPAPRLGADQLNAWLAAHGYRVPPLAFAPLSGYLKGYIDLVFGHGGRFFVLDWKSNHLGDRPADYAPPRLEAAMQAHGYHLQHLLYTLALHRHLGRSLPGYDYERHFGGVLYLFVRGVRPGWRSGEAPEGEISAGVFRHRPAASCIAALDQLFAATEQPA